MDRQITYAGPVINEWCFSKPDQNAMVGLAKLSAAVLGTSGVANGLACNPTSPASMQVTIGQGELYQLAALEATVCGTLPADTTDQILKQGIQLGTVTLAALAAPGTSGQSINYLIEAARNAAPKKSTLAGISGGILSSEGVGHGVYHGC